MNIQKQTGSLNLILGGTGKTGRRVAERLQEQDYPVRIGSRSAAPSFDWDNQATWDACLDGVANIYISYAPDLAVPGATDAIEALVSKAKRNDVQKLVLLSGRGEAEAQACEKIVQESGLDWAIVRASWFNQNFSEGSFFEMVIDGVITLPAGETPEPFVDVDDIADVVVAALVEDGHVGEVYEVTGPQLLTMAEVAKELSVTTGRTIEFVDVSHREFLDGLKENSAPEDVIWMLDYLMSTVLDGRNAFLADGVQKALGRRPKSFAAYARDAVATGVWN